LGKTMQMMGAVTIEKGSGIFPVYGERGNEFSGEVNWARIDLGIVVCVNGR
jgi:hypothetical protein